MKDNAGDVCPHCGLHPSRFKWEAPALQPYTVLRGRYLVGRVLGSGGFGITYIAYDMALDRRVAIKEFFMRGSMDRTGTRSSNVSLVTNSESQTQLYNINRSKFREEAKTLANLEELSGIVRVYDYFDEYNTSYIVMEYLDGCTLRDYVRRQGQRISINDAYSKLEPVMVSLETLHRSGILHRDISPDNIMVLGSGGVKLFDFGGAKKQQGEVDGKSVAIVRKGGFSPLEQYGVDNHGPWTDEYAMAATFYFCITGEIPPDAMRRLNGKERLIPPSEKMISIRPEAERALLKGMSLRWQDRYRTMDEFRRELGAGIEEQKNISHDNDSQDKKRHLWLLPAIIGGIGAVLIFTAVFSSMSSQKKSSDEIDNTTQENDDIPNIGTYGIADSYIENQNKMFHSPDIDSSPEWIQHNAVLYIDQVRKIEEDNGQEWWGHTIYCGKEGWLEMAGLYLIGKDDWSIKVGDECYVSCSDPGFSGTDLKNSPESTDAELSLPYGASLKILELDDMWGKVQFNDQIGWVNANYINSFQSGMVYETAGAGDKAKAVIKPDAKGEAKPGVANGKLFKIDSINDGYAMVRYDDETVLLQMGDMRLHSEYEDGIKLDGQTWSNANPDSWALNPGNHSYQIVNDNVSWSEAFEKCRSMGGHLARIETERELWAILERINAEGDRKHNYYIGARRKTGPLYDYRDPLSYYWVDDDNMLIESEESDLTADSNWASKHWLKRYPSKYDYHYNVEEYVVVLTYSSSDGEWMLNDVMDDLPNWLENSNSKIGFILETEEE